jgi:hypothetical protein
MLFSGPDQSPSVRCDHRLALDACPLAKHRRNVLLCSLTRDRERRLSCVQPGKVTVDKPPDTTPQPQPQVQPNVFDAAGRITFAEGLPKDDLKYVARAIQPLANGQVLNNKAPRDNFLAEVIRILALDNAAANTAFDAAANEVSRAHRRLLALTALRAKPLLAGSTHPNGPSHARQGQE